MGSSESKPLSEEESKVIGGTVGGTTSAASIGAGIGLMFLGPVGMVAGSVLLGAGISSGVSTVQQCTKKGNFDYGQWGISVGIGAVGGGVAAPLSVAGGVAAGAMTSAAAKVGTVVAAEVAGGALSGGVTSTLSKEANGEKATFGDFLKGAAIGGVAGAVGGASGQVASKVASVGSKAIGSAGKSAMRVTIGAAGGAAGGAGSSALATLMENAFNRGEFKRDRFISSIIQEFKVAYEIAEELWLFLCDNKIVVDEEVKEPLPNWLNFPEALNPYREFIKELIDYSLDVTKGVGNAAAQGAVTGAVSGAISSSVQEKIRKQRIAKQVKGRAEQLKKGAHAGTIEAEAYARQNNKKVIIHQDDGSAKTYGSKSSKTEVHLKYDTKEKHYYSADSSGKKLSTQLKNPRHGDCFFEAITHTEGGDSRVLRQNVAEFASKNPMKLKRTTLRELSTGGDCVGAGKRDHFLVPESEVKKAIKEINGKVANKQRASELTRDLKRRGVPQLRSTKTKSVTDNGKSENKIHNLNGNLKGNIAMDVYDSSHGTAGSISNGIDEKFGPRGRDRVVWKKGKDGKLSFVAYTPDHDYSAMYKR